jgi:hypothetical protein
MSFNQKLLFSIEEGLTEALGTQAVKAVDFFVDPRMALSDPKKYWTNLDKMFNHKSKLLQEKLIAKIRLNFSIEDQNTKDLAECVTAAKSKFLKDDLVEESAGMF